MRTKSFLSILLAGLLFIACAAGVASAQAEDSIYAIEGDQTEESVDLPGSALSRTDLFSEEAPLTSTPMEHMDHGSMEGMDHKMPEVELARHEWVSTKQKGYGLAAGITILSGLVFGFLSFKRPNE